MREMTLEVSGGGEWPRSGRKESLPGRLGAGWWGASAAGIGGSGLATLGKILPPSQGPRQVSQRWAKWVRVSQLPACAGQTHLLLPALEPEPSPGTPGPAQSDWLMAGGAAAFSEEAVSSLALPQMCCAVAFGGVPKAHL